MGELLVAVDDESQRRILTYRRLFHGKKPTSQNP